MSVGRGLTQDLVGCLYFDYLYRLIGCSNMGLVVVLTFKQRRPSKKVQSKIEKHQITMNHPTNLQSPS
ncbi:hypothetical protein CR513_34400, partial [Mucuna pruriens]